MRAPRALPSWFVRGAVSAELLDAVTGLRDKALLERERALLERVASELPAAAATRAAPATIIELGADGRVRVAPLLDALVVRRGGVAWAPLNASEPSLSAACASLARRDPRVEILPLDVEVRAAARALARLPSPRLVLVPTGRLASLELDQAVAVLAQLRAATSPDDVFLVGFDQRTTSSACDAEDPRGVVPRLAFGALDRLARELRADFDRRAWRHETRWCAASSRVEEHLVARSRQPVFVDALGRPLLFAAGESIRVEACQRHPEPVADALLAAAGLARLHTWRDEGGAIALVLARACERAADGA